MKRKPLLNCLSVLAVLGPASAVSVALAREHHPPARDTMAMDASARAAATLAAMRVEEKTVLTHGVLSLPIGPNPPPLPADAVIGAGYVPGIARLAVPSLRESDASLGVAYVLGLRKDGATALPSGLAMASTWNAALVEQGGRTIGGEARAKGFNVLLAGGVNLARDPRNGRNFEYLGEDPLLAGTLAGHAIRGIQSAHVISTIKHFALNGQETGRQFVDSKISEASARESDLLAFRIGMEIGNPGAVMCSYNLVNAVEACANDWLLTRVLKQDWGFKGFVMSDWGAVPGLAAALAGLDQQSGEQLDSAVFFGEPLAAAARTERAYAERLDDMNRRILWAIYANGLDRFPAAMSGFDSDADASVAEDLAGQGIVLLRNEGHALPLATSARRIAVIGGYADSGVLSGGGSSQVQGVGGPAVSIPLGGTGPFAAFLAQTYQRSVPLLAMKALAPQADFHFRDGRYIAEAVAEAKKADVVLVFATQWSTEGFDQPDLSLPNGQDALIEAVSRANPHTIVVLETGGPVMMPWLKQAAAVIEAWYPGARGGEAIASVLFGRTNPSGHLPVTFPAAIDQLPRRAIDGFDVLEPDFSGAPPHDPAMKLVADYDVEGSDIGYRWNARKGLNALFPFGYGLSYTSFTTSAPVATGRNISAKITNTGDRDGATVAQLYLVERAGAPKQRLVAFQRIELARGASRRVTFRIDPRLLADWRDGRWSMPQGTYVFATGDDAERLGGTVRISMAARRWSDHPLGEVAAP